jgi:hypothetical protein
VDEGTVHQKSKSRLKGKVNICQNVYSVGQRQTVLSVSREPIVGECYTITSVRNHPQIKSPHKTIVTKANSFAPGTLIFQRGKMIFADPFFTLDFENLARSCYLGHLLRGTRKGCKVYSIHRPCPTFTGWANVLIKDHRGKRKGVRYLCMKFQVPSPSQVHWQTVAAAGPIPLRDVAAAARSKPRVPGARIVSRDL